MSNMMTDTTSLREPMTPQYMAEVVQAAIETLCANGFQSRTHRLCEVRDQLRAAPSPASRARPEAQGEATLEQIEAAVRVLPKGYTFGDAVELATEAATPPADRAPGEVGEAVLDRPARVAGRDFAAGEPVQRVLGRAYAHYDAQHAPSPASRARPEAQGEVDGEGKRGRSRSLRSAIAALEAQASAPAASVDDPVAEIMADWSLRWQAGHAARPGDKLYTRRLAAVAPAGMVPKVEPAPNWCPSCGKRPADPLGILCGDSFHRPAPPATAGEE